MSSSKIVLGIETSCDDTSICLLKGEVGNYQSTPQILSHLSFSHEEILKKWGGVVPEISSRNHLEKLVPLLKEAFGVAQITISDVDLIAVTTNPGLLGPLLTGISSAKTLSLIYQRPINQINHLYAHLEAIHLTDRITYPYVGLIISGGHSIFMNVTSASSFEILGQTTDDAAGEAFDKGAKLLGLGYPGGQIIDQLAATGDKNKFKFPIGLKHSKDANLSFSGLKTSLREFLTKHPVTDPQLLNDICASYQEAIVEALLLKLKFAVSKAGNKAGNNNVSLPIVVGGGVACNKRLRTAAKESFGNNIYFVHPKFCTDNGAMIANYGLRTFDHAVKFPLTLKIDARSKFA